MTKIDLGTAITIMGLVGAQDPEGDSITAVSGPEVLVRRV